MPSLRLVLLFLLGPLLVITACYASPRTCYTPEEAADHPEKDICLNAHVYDVVESADGTRYLDLCKPGVTDSACHMTVVSFAADRKEVGALDTLREQDVHVRGVVHTIHGQSMMLLSHARQLHDGPEKFHPNPELLSGFSASSNGTAFRDPAMTSHKSKKASVFAGSRSGSKY